jgi:hypothetical protein
VRSSIYKTQPYCASVIPDARLRLLAGKIRGLGPRPLFELFRDLARGADLHATLEAYAALFPLREFLRANDGDCLPNLRVAAGTASAGGFR